MARAEPPIRTWTEIVDDHMIVGIATCYVTRAGRVYGHSVFVLCGEPERYGHDNRVAWRAKRAACDAAEARLRKEVYEERHGVLPLVGAMRDVGADGVDLRW